MTDDTEATGDQPASGRDPGPDAKPLQTPRPEEAVEPEGQRGAEEWLEPLFTDSTLVPLVVVMALCLSTVGAAVLVAALYYQNPFAAAALLGLAWIGFDISKRQRRQNGRLGRLGWSIVSLWGLSALVGGIAIGLGLV